MVFMSHCHLQRVRQGVGVFNDMRTQRAEELFNSCSLLLIFKLQTTIYSSAYTNNTRYTKIRRKYHSYRHSRHIINHRHLSMLPLAEGFLLSSTGVILMLLFEFCISMDDVKRFRAREGGKELHAAGIFSTITNHLLFGPCTYYLTIQYGFIKEYYTHRVLWQQAYSVVMFLLIENGLYYCAHSMHRQLYPIHRFHHRFNYIVLPSSASAVSIPEFLLAYMTPFIFAAWGSSSDKASAVVAVLMVITANLIIHTPALEEKFHRYMPWLFVSPEDHLAHHRQLTCHYSAPIFHFDRMIESLKSAVHTIMRLASKESRS